MPGDAPPRSRDCVRRGLDPDHASYELLARPALSTRYESHTSLGMPKILPINRLVSVKWQRIVNVADDGGIRD